MSEYAPAGSEPEPEADSWLGWYVARYILQGCAIDGTETDLCNGYRDHLVYYTAVYSGTAEYLVYSASVGPV